MRTSQPTKKTSGEENQKKKGKPQIFRKYMRTRLAVIFFGVAVALFLLVFAIFGISYVDGESYSKIVLTQQDYSSSTIPFRRGAITDRNLTVLATSEEVYNLVIDPKVILANSTANQEATIEALVACFGFTREEVESLIEDNAESSYVRPSSTRKLSGEEMTVFTDYQTEVNQAASKNNSGKVVGVWFETEYQRSYPYSTLACTLLGFSGSDSSRGNWGIEEYYNDELTGENGREYGYVNEDGVIERVVKEATDGNTVVSTIDYTIQSAAEEYIQEFLAVYSADNVAILVMDPNNGEVLALATDKVYDLNNPTALSAYFTEAEEEALQESGELAEARAQIWKNFAIQDTYEPGSTAKPFTVAAALEENLISTTATFLCTGSKLFGSGSNQVTVRCNKTHGTLTLAESLMYSCNSAMMDIADTLGYEIFCTYQSIFGFGKQTGIDLPGESTGLIYSADSMGVTDLATNAFGQNFNVTMIQLASAFCSLINGGYYYQPHVVSQILNADGEVMKTVEPTVMRLTVSSSTTEFLKEALFETVESGTGSAAAIAGYSIGGKTGTAQK